MYSLVSGYVSDTSCKTSTVMISFLFSIFVVFVFLSSAIDFSPKYMSLLFTLKLLDNSLFLMQTNSNVVIGLNTMFTNSCLELNFIIQFIRYWQYSRHIYLLKFYSSEFNVLQSLNGIFVL